jgi:transcriptional regulator with XRE-family HTH domain
MEPTFGERLTSWLEFLGVRPATLARALEVSRTAIHNWMTGQVEPGTDRLGPIAKALGIPGGVAEFFARMPTLEAKAPMVDDDDEKSSPHPFSEREVTREIPALSVVLDRDTCESCQGTGVKHSGEAA